MTAVINGRTNPFLLATHEPLGRLSDGEIEDAVACLTSFIQERARSAERRLGFGWDPRSDAPSNFDRLRDFFRRSCRTGAPLPVSDEHSNTTLFGLAETNFQLRFIHDVQHVERGANFNPVQELDMTLAHLADLEAFGAPHGSVAWRLLHADLSGQVLCATLVGDFPADQRGFDLDVVELGLDRALVIESDLQTGVTSCREPRHL